MISVEVEGNFRNLLTHKQRIFHKNINQLQRQ